MSTDPLIGSVVAGHRIEAVIGKGAMGVVYRVTHLQLDRTRALKLLPAHLADDASFRVRFEREWRLAAMIEHPNIVEVLDAGEENGRLYIVMRYVEGTDLAAILRAGPLETTRALRIVDQVASALDTAHARDLVHRDVKPSNILIGDGDQAYLSDFGIAKSRETSGLTQAGAFLGTIDYAAPEQFEGGELDARTDVYALGGVLFSCVTGVPPYHRNTDMQVMHAHLMEPPPRASEVRSDLPPSLDRVIATAMEKQKDRRYQSAGALAAALHEALEQPAAAAAAQTVLAGQETALAPPATVAGASQPPETEPPAPDAQRRTRLRAAIAILVAAAIAAAVGAFVVLSGGGESTASEAQPGTTTSPGTTDATDTTAGSDTSADTTATDTTGTETTGDATGTDASATTGTESGGSTDPGTSTFGSSTGGAPLVQPWTRVTATNGVNTDIVALARTPDGVLHVAWQRREPSGKGGIWHTALGKDGKLVGKTNAIVSGWAGVNTPDLIRTSNGGLQVFFGGLRGQGAGDPNSSLNTATSTRLGTIWSLVEGSVTKTTSVYARNVGAALAPDGTPVVAWDGNSPEAAYHFGIDPSGPEFRYVEKLTKETCGCPLLPDIGVDSKSGDLVLAWHSLLSERPGIHAQTITRTGPGPAKRAPGSDRIDSQRVGVTGRIGAPGVYLGYAVGSPVTDVRLWRAGSAAPALSIRAPSVDFVNIAAAPEGRLWLMWARDQQLFFTRSNRGATAVGPIVSVAPPKGTTQVWKLNGEASLGPLDVFSGVSVTNSLATWHTQVLPALTLEATENAGPGDGRTITFRALDAGDPVAGASVEVGGEALTTGGDGTAVLTQTEAATVSATVAKSGYHPARTDV